MKNYTKFIFVLFLVFSILSCEKSKEESSAVEAKKEPFKITLVAKIEHNCTFKLYYSLNNGEFTEQNIINEFVIGGPMPQEIVFDLPANKKITGFRIDFGRNDKNNRISLKSVKMEKGDEVYETQELIKNFKFNEFVKFDEENREFILSRVNERYNPNIATKEESSQILKKIQKEKPKA